MASNNSTNVRSIILRSGFSALQTVSPKLAARAASLLFLRTPPRGRRPSSLKTGVMAQAERFEVRFERRTLAGFSWGAAGPCVLLVHGWGGRASQLRHFVEPLRAKGYRVVAFDAPGHGASTGSELSLPVFARAIHEIAAQRGPLAAVVAHSFGAAASVVAIAEGLELERAALIGPPSDEMRWFDLFCQHLALSPRTRQSTQAAIERRIGARFDSFSAEALGPRVGVPLLVLHDRHDREVPWEDGQRIARAAHRATLVTTSGLGHRRILRSAPVIESVIQFLSGKAMQPPELATGCRRCQAPLLDTWAGPGELCMSCELAVELANRDLRWAAALA